MSAGHASESDAQLADDFEFTQAVEVKAVEERHAGLAGALVRPIRAGWLRLIVRLAW